MSSKNTPIVSVLTTVFNCEPYLTDCIESVLASTFKEWEMIIVDDCSTDKSFSIASEFMKKDDRVKAFINEQNLGDYPNRNKAASLAKGKYLKYLDADDLIYPHSLEIMINTMEKFPEAALGISQEVSEDYQPYPFQLMPHETYSRHFLKKGVLDLGPTGTIIKRSVFNELGGFSGTRYVGDSEYWLKTSAIYPVVKMQSGLIFWRRHEGQEFQLGNLKNDYIILNYSVKMNALASNTCPLSGKENLRASQWINYRHSRAILNICCKKMHIKRTMEIMKETKISIIQILVAILPWKIYQKIA